MELNELKKKHFYYNFLQRIFINFKFKEVRLSVYEDKNNITVNGNELPMMEAIIGRTRLAVKVSKG